MLNNSKNGLPLKEEHKDNGQEMLKENRQGRNPGKHQEKRQG